MITIYILIQQTQFEVQWTTDKLMSVGDQNKHQLIQKSTYPFGNIKIEKGWGSERINRTLKSTCQVICTVNATETKHNS